MCTYHFFKKKKKKSEMELWQWHCRIPFHISQFQKFFFTPLFRQCHCHNCQKFIPSISAMPLPQTIFFFLPFSAMALPQINWKIFFFFFYPISAMPLPQFHSTFFFFLRNNMCTQFLQQILSGRSLLLD